MKIFTTVVIPLAIILLSDTKRVHIEMIIISSMPMKNNIIESRVTWFFLLKVDLFLGKSKVAIWCQKMRFLSIESLAKNRDIFTKFALLCILMPKTNG